MTIYTLQRKQLLNVNLDRAWDFFSSPLNLREITPPYLNFSIKTKFSEESKIYPGMIIIYTVSPIFNLPFTWVTEITQIKEKEYFIDEQRFGPYAFWHHEHFLKEVGGQTEMEDLIHYKLKFGFLGSLLNPLIVKKKLNQIFQYRNDVLNLMFKE